MKKSDLKNGCVVELRNGTKSIKIDNTLVNFYIFNDKISCGWLKFDDYNEDLTFKKEYEEEKEWDIMKVNNSVVKEERYCFSAIHTAFNTQKDTWTWVREEKPKRILTPKEYNYLKAVIAPFRDRVAYIDKCNSLDEFENIKEDEQIRIWYKGTDEYYYQDIILYEFKKGTEYKGMELDKEYTLEELGL